MNGFQFEIILSAFKIFALDSFENRRSTPRLPLQSKKQQETYCAAFYASLSLLAGSSNNVSCNGGKNGTNNEVRDNVVPFIYLYLAFHC